MELSAFFFFSGERVIIYALLKSGHFVFFFANLDSTGFNMCTICLKMGSQTLWSSVFNNSHSRDCAAGFSIRILWYDGANMWPFSLFCLLEPVIKKHITLCVGRGWGALLMRWHCVRSGNPDAKSSIHSSPLTSDVIRSYKWQLLAWSRIHQGGAARWPPALSPPPLLQLSLIGKTRSSPCGQWLTKWWITSSVLACWSIVAPTFCPRHRVDIGICHSAACGPESHNCWLVKWVPALWNN